MSDQPSGWEALAGAGLPQAGIGKPGETTYAFDALQPATVRGTLGGRGALHVAIIAGATQLALALSTPRPSADTHPSPNRIASARSLNRDAATIDVVDRVLAVRQLRASVRQKGKLRSACRLLSLALQQTPILPQRPTSRPSRLNETTNAADLTTALRCAAGDLQPRSRCPPALGDPYRDEIAAQSAGVKRRSATTAKHTMLRRRLTRSRPAQLDGDEVVRPSTTVSSYGGSRR